MGNFMKQSILKQVLRRLLPLGVCLGLAMPAWSISPEGKFFPTPDAAADAFVSALKTQDVTRVLEVLGGRSHEMILSGDPTQDQAAWKRFVEAYEQAHELEKWGDNSRILVVGPNRYPFSLPVRQTQAGWQFDIEAGLEESLNRRIGRNELTTIAVLRQVVLAQDEFFLRDAAANRAGQYAGRFESSEGRRDGLYWPVVAGEPPSPLGPLVARAARQGYTSEASAYFGYHYRMLPGQGRAARGGARNYVVNGRQIAGFAVLAWPVSYGVSGIKSFIVNQDGVVYERDLGPGTAKQAEAIRLFDPGKGWSPAPDK